MARCLRAALTAKANEALGSNVFTDAYVCGYLVPEILKLID